MSQPFLQPMDIARLGREEYLRVSSGPMDLRAISDALGQDNKRKSSKRRRQAKIVEGKAQRIKLYQSLSEVVADLRILFDGALQYIESQRFPLVRRRIQAMSHYMESVAGAVEGTALWSDSLYN